MVKPRMQVEVASQVLRERVGRRCRGRRSLGPAVRRQEISQACRNNQSRLGSEIAVSIKPTLAHVIARIPLKCSSPSKHEKMMY
jgi:hypothetical protein